MASPNWKPLRPALALALVIAAAAMAPRADAARVAQPAARDPSAPLYCVQVWPEARYRNYGYDHYVHVYNGCTASATCDVSTDVAPKPIKARVRSGEAVSVLTFRGSPSQEFVPRVYCVLD